MTIAQTMNTISARHGTRWRALYSFCLRVVLISSGGVFLFKAKDGIREVAVTGVQTCALPISPLNAYLVLDSSAAPTAPPLAFNDSCSGGGRDACLPYQLLRTAGTYLIEATSAASGETGRFTLSVTRPRAPTGPTRSEEHTSELQS